MSGYLTAQNAFTVAYTIGNASGNLRVILAEHLPQEGVIPQKWPEAGRSESLRTLTLSTFLVFVIDMVSRLAVASGTHTLPNISSNVEYFDKDLSLEIFPCQLGTHPYLQSELYIRQFGHFLLLIQPCIRGSILGNPNQRPEDTWRRLTSLGDSERRLVSDLCTSHVFFVTSLPWFLCGSN